MSQDQKSVDDFINQVIIHQKLVLLGPMDHETPVETSLPVLFVDGGLRKNYLDFYCRLIVGDADSVTKPIPPFDILYPKNKDFSDLQGALNLIPNNNIHIDAIGFMGGRKDHELMNLGAFYHFMQLRPCIPKISLLKNNINLYGTGKVSFECFGIFGLLSFDSTYFEITGQCQYQLKKTLIPKLSSTLLSNQGNGIVTIETDNPFFVILN